MKKTLLSLLMLSGFAVFLNAQETFPLNDVKDIRSGAYAFTNATIQVDFQNKIDNGTLLIRDGKIENVGSALPVPRGYTQVDLQGKYIYPSLIDMYSSYGLPKVKRSGFSFGRQEQIQSKTPGPFNSNEAIKAEYKAFDEFKVDEKEAKNWRKLGFGTVLTFKPDGVARGASAVVTLAEDNENTVMLNSRAAAHYSFSKGSSTQSYPVSAMGYISLLRQTYLDAAWYNSRQEKTFTDKSLDAWLALQDLPQIFEANSWISLLRADKVGDEFGVQYIIKAGGNEYRRIKEIKASGASLIVPINFPAAHDVEDPIDTYRISLADMKHWELAPTNLSHLESNGIDFAITAHGLKDKKKFWENIRKAIEHGLSEESALKALTETPARLLGMSEQIGKVEKGMPANFLITSGKLFDKETVIYENWIQGKNYQLQDMNAKDFSGEYVLAVNGKEHQLKITGKPGKQKAKIVVNDTTEIKVNMKADGELVSLSFNPSTDKKSIGKIALSGWATGKDLKGQGQLIDGTWISWSALYQQEGKTEDKMDAGKGKGKKEEKKGKPKMGKIIFPFVAYGSTTLPQQEDILIKNATVWTMEEEGIMENTDVLLKGGKISRIGKKLSAKGVRVIDGTGKHLTPGIIDEHSHTAGGGNEILSNSSMVRIGDQINSEDINIYRALSGGVTAIQVLHGSADPIGGQSALIKLRWGSSPEELKIKGAGQYIKFALGENVKRSRSTQSIRYPQTRMGVEQVYMDAFTSALDYEKKWKNYNELSASEKENAVKPRKDLAMEAMVDIVRKRMFITCHSYVQSEINMLMNVANHFGFRVNTFTHILEGYKVADKMAAHGAGGSTFSDWWAYKWEVRYAIPYNAAIMSREGVVTAINSDDSEMMRRLNQEAAKSVKYGGLSEIDALKMVTINPAKLLHLDDRMGSLKVGKDADVVLWSDHPLSIYARAEKTIVDGKIYFDMERDQELKMQIQRERARLVQKMRKAKVNGGPSQKGRGRVMLDMQQCDDIILYSEE